VIISPCIKVCALDPQRSFCIGCCRTLDEIVRWSSMSNEERETVMRSLALRASFMRQGMTASDAGMNTEIPGRLES